MNIEDYLKRLSDESQDILQKTIEFRDDLGKAHHLSSCIYEFGDNLNGDAEKEILKTVSSQLESATLSACLGMYRQAFSSLRLVLEMGLAATYFSVHKLDLHEWREGATDIKWASLMDEENGILSTRFCNAFFKEFTSDFKEYRTKARAIYRSLSEFVHGNWETWSSTEIELSFDGEKLELYFDSVKSVSEVLLFVLSCRYLKTFSSSTLESLQFIPEEMNHISYIREYFGGPRE